MLCEKFQQFSVKTVVYHNNNNQRENKYWKNSLQLGGDFLPDVLSRHYSLHACDGDVVVVLNDDVGEVVAVVALLQILACNVIHGWNDCCAVNAIDADFLDDSDEEYDLVMLQSELAECELRIEPFFFTDFYGLCNFFFYTEMKTLNFLIIYTVICKKYSLYTLLDLSFYLIILDFV